MLSSSDSSWMWLENVCRAFTPGSEASSVSSVGSIWAEMFWMNFVFSSLCSLAMLMVFFCLRVSTMKRNNTMVPNIRTAARMAANTQRPMMMYCLALRESSFSWMVARLSSYFRFRTFSSSCAVSAFTESVHRIYLS